MGYVAAGYGITIGTIVAYSAWIIVRGRRLKR